MNIPDDVKTLGIPFKGKLKIKLLGKSTDIHTHTYTQRVGQK